MDYEARLISSKLNCSVEWLTLSCAQSHAPYRAGQGWLIASGSFRKVSKMGSMQEAREERRLLSDLLLQSRKMIAALPCEEKNDANGVGGAEKQFGIELLKRAMHEHSGFCLACGAEQKEIEPYARLYHCVSCSHDNVYGAEKLMMQSSLF